MKSVLIGVMAVVSIAASTAMAKEVLLKCEIYHSGLERSDTTTEEIPLKIEESSHGYNHEFDTAFKGLSLRSL